jgi:uncharacterized protein YjiS (DUF1127 family)
LAIFFLGYEPSKHKDAKEYQAMTNINLPHRDLSPYFRRAHIERAKAAADLVRAAGRAIDGWATAVAAAHARRRLRRETTRQLASLSDRTLRDIGIPRGAIWTVADDLVNAVTGPAVSDSRQPQRARPERLPTATHVAAGCG